MCPDRVCMSSWQSKSASFFVRIKSTKNSRACFIHILVRIYILAFLFILKTTHPEIIQLYSNCWRYINKFRDKYVHQKYEKKTKQNTNEIIRRRRRRWVKTVYNSEKKEKIKILFIKYVPAIQLVLWPIGCSTTAIDANLYLIILTEKQTKKEKCCEYQISIP